jgi:hypothetical protein
VSEDREPSGAEAEPPWTDDELAAFARALRAFQASLTPRQQVAFDQIMATSQAALDGGEVRGYVSAAIYQAWADQGRFLKAYYSNTNKVQPQSGNQRSRPTGMP